MRAVVIIDKGENVGETGCTLYACGGTAARVPVRVPVPPELVAKGLECVGDIDAFCGTTAVVLASGGGLLEAVQAGVHVAAVSVQRRGCQPSFPTAVELPAGVLRV